MANRFWGGGESFQLSNGSTAVLHDVLLLAVSELARHEWELRFAGLVGLLDQDHMGLGMVGFRLEELDWGTTPAEQAAAKDFVLRTIDLALDRHRWDELGYDPPFVEGHLRVLRSMVGGFDPATAAPDGRAFPTGDEVAAASCVRHRVLITGPWYRCCYYGDAGGR